MNSTKLSPAVCASFVAALRSWRAGFSSADNVHDMATMAVADELGEEHEQVLVGLSDTGEAIAPETLTRPLAEVLPQLTLYSPNEIRLVVPRPGDPRAVAGTGEFAAAALEMGAGAIIGNLGMLPYAIPGRFVQWRVFSLDRPASPQWETVGEAEHELLLALRASSEIFAQWDGQRIGPELRQALAELRDSDATRLMPAGYDARSTRVAARATMVWKLTQLATTAPAGASSAWEIATHAAELRKLQQLAEQALMAAINAPLAGS